MDETNEKTILDRRAQLSDDARSLIVNGIKTQEECKRAAVALSGFKDLKSSIKSFFKDPKASAHRTWKLICEREAEVVAPVDVAITGLTSVITEFRSAESARLEEDRKKTEEGIARLLEDDQLTRAIEAEEKGDLAQAEAILDGRDEQSALMVQPSAPGPARIEVPGFSTRERWVAECYDIRALVYFIVTGESSFSGSDKGGVPQLAREDLLPLITNDAAACRDKATQTRGPSNIPGLRFLKAESLVPKR